jgi:hypothetical protein
MHLLQEFLKTFRKQRAKKYWWKNETTGALFSTVNPLEPYFSMATLVEIPENAPHKTLFTLFLR